MTWLTRFGNSCRKLVSRPTEELTRVQRSLRFAVDLCRHCAAQLGGNRAPQMAAALAYRTLFSLVPMAVLGLLVLRAFVSIDDAQQWFQRSAYEFLGWSAIAMPPGKDAPAGATPAPPSKPHAEPDGAQQPASADQVFDRFVQRAWQLRFGSIGFVGLLVLIWAALGLMVTVEQAFNRIYNCPAGRPWHQRIFIYWSVITLGPVLLFVSLHLTGNLADWAASHVGPMVSWFSGFTALGASWLLLLLLYLLMPNGQVHWRPALAGSFVAALLWEIGKWGFQLYLEHAVMISQLYGSLGLIPLFLLWIYLTWLIVLFGLQIAYTLQVIGHHQFEIDQRLERQEPASEPRCMLNIMTVIGKAFAKGQPVRSDHIVQQLLTPALAVSRIIQRLQEAGLLHEVAATHQHAGGYSLAVPPEKIPISRLLDLCRNSSDGAAGQTESILQRLDVAQHQAVGGQTLASLIEP